MVIYEANGYARRRADATDGNPFVAMLSETLQGCLYQRFAPYRRSLTMKFWS